MNERKERNLTFTVEPQTLFLLVGPSMAGKTTFAKRAMYLLQQQLLGAGFADWYLPVIRHISSDAIRRSLYGIDEEEILHKYDPKMVQASQAAFENLSWQVEQAMLMPFNAEFIFVDSTALDPDFREHIKKLGERHSYKVVLVMFDYRKNEDYFTGLGEDVDSRTKFIIHKHIRRLREGYSQIKARSYDGNINIVKKEDIEKVNFEVQLDDYRKTFLQAAPQAGYQFYGDVQGCYKTLLALLKQDGFQVDLDTLKITGLDKTTLVFVGDLIDKGPDSLKVIRLLLANQDRVRVVLGNHESFVYKFFTGQLKENTLPEKEIMDTYFTSIAEFKDDPSAIADLIRFVEEMCAPFLRHQEFIVTHAPCKHRHLGKLHGEGRKKQMNIRMVKKRKDFETIEAYTEFAEQHLSFLKKDASVNSMPSHIFGHVMLKEPLQLRKNKIGIDTGAANKGGRLTSCYLLGNKKFVFSSVPVHESEFALDETMPILFEKKRDPIGSVKTRVDLSDLDEREEKRLFRMARQKINFVSGTMSPSWSNKQDQTLESVGAALAYYVSKGIKEVVLQPKYMGSRAQVYLFAEKPTPESSDQDMAVSRNGYLPRFLNLAPFYDSLRERYKSLFAEQNASLLIFDGELMPWSALGETLIDDIFRPMAVGIRTELDMLQKLGFPDTYRALKTELESEKQHVSTLSKKDLSEYFGLQQPDFEARFQESRPPEISAEEHEKSRKAFAEKLGYSKVASLYAMREFEVLPLEETAEYVKIYERQLEVFGQLPEEGKANPYDFKAFALLKAVHTDGKETVFVGPDQQNDSWFSKINTDESLTLNLDLPEDWKRGEEFFKSLCAQELEGVVVKPRQIQPPGNIAPYLKVRGRNYLTLIYGYDYLNSGRYADLIYRKSINRKLDLSISEYELGRLLLQIPRSEISPDNQDYLSLVKQLIIEERAEKKLDPCL